MKIVTNDQPPKRTISPTAAMNTSLLSRESTHRKSGAIPSTFSRGPPNQAKIAPPSKPPICPQLSIPGDNPMIKLTMAIMMILFSARRATPPNTF